MLKNIFATVMIIITSGCSVVGDVMEMRLDTTPYIEKEIFNEFKIISYSEIMREKKGSEFLLNTYVCRQDTKNNNASISVYIERLDKKMESDFFKVSVTGSNVIPSDEHFMRINGLLILAPFNENMERKYEDWLTSKKLRYQFSDLDGRTYETLERDLPFLKDFYETCFILMEHNKYLKDKNKKVRIRKA